MVSTDSQRRDSFTAPDDHPFGHKDAAALEAAERAPKFIVLRHHSTAAADDHGAIHLASPVITTSQRLHSFLIDGRFPMLVDHIRSTILPRTIGTSAQATTGTVRLNVRGVMILVGEQNWAEVKQMAKREEGTLEYWFAVHSTDYQQRGSAMVGMTQGLRLWERARGWVEARGARVVESACSPTESHGSRSRRIPQLLDLRPRRREVAWWRLCPEEVKTEQLRSRGRRFTDFLTGRVRRSEVAWWKFC